MPHQLNTLDVSAHGNNPATNAYSWRLVLLYVLCLLPFSIDGFGVNYLFVLIPAWSLFSGRTLVWPPAEVVLFMCGCVATFLVSSIYQLEWMGFFDRRLISCLLFLTMFSLCFIRFTDRYITAFRMAVVIGALFLALHSLLTFESLGVAAQAFESKDIVGSQRIGFVHILAFWIIWYDAALIPGKLMRPVLMVTLLLGLTLTFSRASIVAFGSSGIIAVGHAVATTRHSFMRLAGHLATGIAFALLGVLAIYLVAPVIFDFFYERLIDYVISGASAEAIVDPETSDGTRIFIWTHITEYVLNNPLTGAGFMGVWALNLFEGFSGSSHSQYFDALFRLGPLLFLGYIYFLMKILRHYSRTDVGLCVGFTGVLVYGLFHETFKEPHGTFILAMLLADTMRRREPRPIRRTSLST